MSEAPCFDHRPDVHEQEDLWRRVHSSQIVPNKKGGCRPMSGAFRDRELSVDIASKTTPEKSIAGSASLASFSAGIPKRQGYRVVEDPIIPTNPAHALVLGPINQTHRREIASKCVWVIPPSNSHRL